MYNTAAEIQINGLALRTDEGSRSHPHERLLRCSWPSCNGPPAVQFAGLIKVCSRYHYGSFITGTCHGVGEWNCEATPSERRGNFVQGIRGQCLAVFCNDHDIRSVVAKLFTQLGLNIDEKIEHSGDHSGSYYHR